MTGIDACRTSEFFMRIVIKRFLLRCISFFVPYNRALVIYYHDIGDKYTKMGTETRLFKAHVATARKQGYEFVSGIEALTEDSVKAKRLLLCFDDGFRGIYDEREYFVREGLCPVVFLAVDLVGKPGYLTWDEIRELQNIGFAFQSHTFSHRSLTDVPTEELKDELSGSRQILSQKLGREVLQLCFPRGAFSPRVLKACENAGYQALFTSIPGCAMFSVEVPGLRTSVRLVPRVLAQHASVGEFKSLLCGAMSYFRRRYVRRHFVESDI